MSSKDDKKPPPGRHGYQTPAEQQAAALSKLLANPTKPIVIPERPKEGASKTLRAPREMMKNVQGSSAGAGSGEFVSLVERADAGRLRVTQCCKIVDLLPRLHAQRRLSGRPFRIEISGRALTLLLAPPQHVYKQARRREYERLKIMDEEEEYVSRRDFTCSCPRQRTSASYAHATAQRRKRFIADTRASVQQFKQKSEAEQRQAEYAAAAEAKTAKNRQKRQRKKQGRKKGGKEGDSDDDGPTPAAAANGDGEGDAKKRKLASGAVMKFKTADERDEEDVVEETREEREQRIDDEIAKEQAAAEVAPAKEAGIVIQDDD